MDLEEMTLEDKCEHLMNVVVETRKRFGKMCIEYTQKSSLMENKILNLQVETIANCRIKPKTQVPDIPFDELINDMDAFKQDVADREKTIDEVRKKIRNLEKVVVQIKSDHVQRRLEKPINTEAMLASARSKKDK